MLESRIWALGLRQFSVVNTVFFILSFHPPWAGIRTRDLPIRFVNSAQDSSCNFSIMVGDTLQCYYAPRVLCLTRLKHSVICFIGTYFLCQPYLASLLFCSRCKENRFIEPNTRCRPRQSQGLKIQKKTDRQEDLFELLTWDYIFNFTSPGSFVTTMSAGPLLSCFLGASW